LANYLGIETASYAGYTKLILHFMIMIDVTGEINAMTDILFSFVLSGSLHVSVYGADESSLGHLGWTFYSLYLIRVVCLFAHIVHRMKSMKTI